MIGLFSRFTNSRLLLQTAWRYSISLYTTSNWPFSTARSIKDFAYLPAKRGLYILKRLVQFYVFCQLLNIILLAGFIAQLAAQYFLSHFYCQVTYFILNIC